MKKEAKRDFTIKSIFYPWVACKLASNPQFEAYTPCSNYFIQMTE
jgi:hypothetical protein